MKNSTIQKTTKIEISSFLPSQCYDRSKRNLENTFNS